MKIPVNIIIFSQSADKNNIIESLNEIKNNLKTVCLSTHKLFDLEKKELLSKHSKELEFLSFYHFINEEEMISCDTEADRIILEKYGARARSLNKYYEKIKELKNKIIFQNLAKIYEFHGRFLLSDDLGIFSGVWIDNGFKDLSQDYAAGRKSTIKIKKLFKTANNIIKGILNYRVVCIMHTLSTDYLFWGRPDRILQYLDAGNVKIEKIDKLNVILLFMMYRAIALSGRNFLIKALANLFFFLFRWIYILCNQGKKLLDFLSPIHEDNDTYGILAKRLGVKMFYMQDGYLPENYSSAYLCYRMWASAFHIWDKLSAGIFKRHNLNWEKANYFKSMQLPKQKERLIKVRSIVVLTSGAGDWTALKNRSDEDLMFEAFIKVAKELPGVRIKYRPHPLWTHPTHQGVNSINRLFDYATSLRLKNFVVSAESLKEGTEYNKDLRLSRKPTSINEEIEEADIVFGDHSQAIINAGMKGKIFASVSLSRRTEFFCNYTRLGFPFMKSAGEIINFIKGLEISAEVIKKFNQSVDLYNNKYL